MNSIVDWIKSHQLQCYIKNNYGVECPGCGIQTAFILLLEGKITESIHAYPALIPMLISIFFIFLNINFKKNWIKKVLTISLISTVVIIIGNFLFKVFFR